MKRLITAGTAVILVGLGIGTAAAQPPIPYGPVPEPRATRRYRRRDTDTTGSRAGGIGTAIDTSGIGGHWVAGGPRYGELDSRSLAVEWLPLHLGAGTLGLMPAGCGQRSSTTTGT